MPIQIVNCDRLSCFVHKIPNFLIHTGCSVIYIFLRYYLFIHPTFEGKQHFVAMAYYYLYSTIPKKPLTSIFMSSPHIIFNFSLHKFVPSTTPSLFPSRHRSKYCTWVSAVSCSVAETDEQHHIASNGLVHKEYADLNLSDLFCEV